MIYATGSNSLHRYPSLDEVMAQAAEWLDEGRIGMVVGYGRQSPFTDLTMPTFVVSKEQMAQELVWNRFCDYNLLNYANLGVRQAAQGKGGVAILVKPCELHNLDILMEEGNMSGVSRDNVLPMVMHCEGIYETEDLNVDKKGAVDPRVQTKCLDCPEYLAAHGAIQVTKEQSEREDYRHYVAAKADDSSINWTATLNKCLHCYACRNVCPSCYCTEGCPADEAATAHVTNALKMVKNIETSRQVVYNLVRTWHIQARCSECQECERVCPVDIPIMALKSKLGREFEGEGSPGDVMGFLVKFAGRMIEADAARPEVDPK